ncbi:hypothetical protein BS47DRAFT_39582 [Hydnum rufescens UP504]|uniref:Uncharacterized protein n=1 Tax=Hydnum rufescens UP504 TaxID=1448309 RepID=A0A9P6DTQ7_9AGAM|nr:hypothetical protein BS47DRAFT_39582 [Hydnum rufescens UP504]
MFRNPLALEALDLRLSSLRKGRTDLFLLVDVSRPTGLPGMTSSSILTLNQIGYSNWSIEALKHFCATIFWAIASVARIATASNAQKIPLSYDRRLVHSASELIVDITGPAGLVGRILDGGASARFILRARDGGNDLRLAFD